MRTCRHDTHSNGNARSAHHPPPASLPPASLRCFRETFRGGGGGRRAADSAGKALSSLLTTLDALCTIWEFSCIAGARRDDRDE